MVVTNLLIDQKRLRVSNVLHPYEPWNIELFKFFYFSKCIVVSQCNSNLHSPRYYYNWTPLYRFITRLDFLFHEVTSQEFFAWIYTGLFIPIDFCSSLLWKQALRWLCYKYFFHSGLPFHSLKWFLLITEVLNFNVIKLINLFLYE